MRFIQEFGYTVKIGEEEAHQRWLEENDAALRAAMPKGTKYIGTFAVIFTSEKQAGGYKNLVELDSDPELELPSAFIWRAMVNRFSPTVTKPEVML